MNCVILLLVLLWVAVLPPSVAQTRTYCNPINIDYGYTPIPNFAQWGRHRASADPVIVQYKGDFYLFSTNQWGYWWSSNLSEWNFVPRKFLRPWHTGIYDELCAPAVGVVGDTMLVFGSTYSSNFTLWMSTDPKANRWQPLIDSLEIGGWDPAFFTDDDGRFYMYNGSSNVFPLYGIELDRLRQFRPKGTRREMHYLKHWRFGWQRFGEHSDNTFLDPFMEGAWMTKHNGKYYLQYGAPGTEFSGYADGVAVGNHPLGPFTDQSDPLSTKAGGFARGAGHGATFQDTLKNWWHTSTIMLSVKNNFERRIGIWPAGFDTDDVMWCNTAFGDYPHYLPYHKPKNRGTNYHDFGYFTGWMLLNYQKPVMVSSTYGAHTANFAVDENMKTYWSAASGRAGEWFQTDLGEKSTVHAIQVNFADQDAEFLGKSTGVSHQYRIYHSPDGKKWQLLVDKSNNVKDVPHDYVELPQPVVTRLLKIENLRMPTGKFALSGFRVFGRGNGNAPAAVQQFMVLRTEKDRRSAWIRWQPVDDAYAYNIYYGTHPDKMYSCLMVYDANEYWFKAMDATKTYFFTIEAINENGISARFPVIKVE